MRSPKTPRWLARATAVVVLAATVLACGPGGASPTAPPQTPVAGAEDRIHQQATAALARWDEAVGQASRDAVVFVGELTNQVGDWEQLVGDNNKQALMAGLVRPVEKLSTDTPPPGELKWPDGTTRSVRLLSATEALLQTANSASSPCPECRPLLITDARLITAPAATSRGTATVPMWEFAAAGTHVRITRVAVADRVSVVPPPWDPNNAPEGISIDSARGTAAARELEVTFTGAPDRGNVPCGADYTAEGVESDRAVVVIVIPHENPARVVCSAVGATRTAELALAAPLGDRAVLEVKQGLPVPVLKP